MESFIKLSEELQHRLLCPKTKSKLTKSEGRLQSVTDKNISYPIIDGIPVLINNVNSIFSTDNYNTKEKAMFNRETSKIKKLIIKILPDIGLNIKANKNYKKIINILPADAKILIVGGGIMGKGMEPIYSNKAFDLVDSDVVFSKHTNLICDSHDIPFEENTFDCVIIQAVLEHVLDPQRCVSEVYRVLKPSGLVYAETPFIQQVHGKEHDFTRFTHLGHRRLFRHFKEIDSGPVCGPGMALAWSYKSFLKSFASSRKGAQVLTAFAMITSFFLKYFDYYLIDKPGSYDAASGFFFMGTKSDKVLHDKDLITQFRGIK